MGKQLIESFHLMYDHSPETVMLPHKSRVPFSTIIGR